MASALGVIVLVAQLLEPGASLVADATVKATASKPLTPKPARPPPPPLCDGDYADALPAQEANRIVDGAREPFVFAIRNTATYEHVYYGREGKLRRAYLRSILHGTGFAYRSVGGETWLVTNEHVASQPEVTDEEHVVEGVPVGSKKVREQLKIVRDESDDYEPSHIALTKALSDPASDIAVLKAKKSLPVVPYRIGRSSALRPGNVVQVRGFPLGAFAALNSGKVVNPYTQDGERGWNHSDFVIDALLSSGNSGSPVFAIGCRSGEPELVGVFHAGYTEAAALNAVVAIDQLREELETLHLPKRDQRAPEITAADRDRLVKSLFADQGHMVTFPFAGRAVQVQLVDPTTLRFAILDDDFPLVTKETMTLFDRAANGFGTLDAVSFLVDGALGAEVPVTAFEGEVRDHFDKLYDSLWHHLLAVVDYRSTLRLARTSADAFAEASSARARLKKRTAEQKELLGICAFDADRSNLGGHLLAAPLSGSPAPAAPPPAAPVGPGQPPLVVPTLPPTAPAVPVPEPATRGPAETVGG